MDESHNQPIEKVEASLAGSLGGARFVFTTRNSPVWNGVSQAPFDTLNLGDHVNDDPAHVARNRALVQARIGARPVYLKQVHGTDVAVIDTHTAAGSGGVLVADAAVTMQRGVACTIMVADCLPVLFADAAGTVVAAAHAGWRGLAAGVLEAVFAEFLKQKQALAHTESASQAINSIANTTHKRSFDAALAPSEVTVWLGPCIGPTVFEVGAEVREAFVAQDRHAERYFRPQGSAQGKYLADLAGLARARLHALGLTQITGNDGTLPWCTVTNESAFFSHRRDAARLGSSGRMAACIWLP